MLSIQTAISAIAAAAAVASLLSGEWLLLLYACLVLAIPVVVIITGRWAYDAFRGKTANAVQLGTMIFIVCTAIVRTRDFDDKSIDAQVLARLVAIFAIPVFYFTTSQGSLLPKSFTARAWLLYLAYGALSAFYSPAPLLNLFYAASIVLAFLFMLRCVPMLGPGACAEMFVLASALICIVSIPVYYLHPELGQTYIWVGEVRVLSNRLRGITQAPGLIAALALISLIIGFGYRKLMRPHIRLGFWVSSPFLVACAFLSNGRMAMAAFFIASAVYWVRIGNATLKTALLISVACVGFIIFQTFGEAILSELSRTGKISEIQTLTGRSDIWAVVLDYWAKSPVFGYGYNSAVFILPKDPRLFVEAAHTHNMYLDPLFWGGTVGFVLFTVPLAMSFYQSVKAGSAETAVFAFFLVLGMTEVPITGLINMLPLAFFFCVTLSDAKHRTGTAAYRPQNVAIAASLTLR